MWATCQFVGGAAGPVLAGLLLQHFWWGSVFLIAVPVMVLLLLAGPRSCCRVPQPGPRPGGPGERRAVPGGCAAGGVRLKQLAVGGSPSLTAPLGSIAAGAALGVVFVRRQLRLEAPLLDLRLLRSRSFTAVLASLLLRGRRPGRDGPAGHPVPAERAGLLAPGLGPAVHAYGPGGRGRHDGRPGPRAAARPATAITGGWPGYTSPCRIWVGGCARHLGGANPQVSGLRVYGSGEADRMRRPAGSGCSGKTLMMARGAAHGARCCSGKTQQRCGGRHMGCELESTGAPPGT